jgi:hypothetical protein
MLFYEIEYSSGGSKDPHLGSTPAYTALVRRTVHLSTVQCNCYGLDFSCLPRAAGLLKPVLSEVLVIMPRFDAILAVDDADALRA